MSSSSLCAITNFLFLPLLSVAESVSMPLPKSIMVSGKNVVHVDFVFSVVVVLEDAVVVSFRDWLVVADIGIVVVMLLSFVSTLATLSRH
jgi:hypothetical protein